MWPDYVANYLHVSGRLPQKHPGLAECIIRTHINVMDYTNAHLTEVAAIYANRARKIY